MGYSVQYRRVKFSMAFIPWVFAMVVTLATASASTHSSLPDPPPSSPHAQHAELTKVLQELGFNEACVAAALDTCAVTPRESQLVTLIKEARDLLQGMGQAVNRTRNYPRHCKDLQDVGDGQSGVRLIHPYPGEPDRRLAVYCDQTTDGGGWTMFQRRTNATVREDFYRTWKEYQLGFGNPEHEFWLGLEPLHALTSTGLQELRVDLADWDGEYRYAKYRFFHVEDEAAKYRLLIGRYSGTAGDGLTGHGGSKFSTHDSDNDSHEEGSCATSYRGAWWYKKCHSSNLNGYQYVGDHTSYADGINWYDYKGHHYSLRHTAMMVRPAF